MTMPSTIACECPTRLKANWLFSATVRIAQGRVLRVGA